MTHVLRTAAAAMLTLGLAAGPAAAKALLPVETVWSCRNEALEIACPKGVCAVSKTHTPIDVTVSPKAINACAYSGCWSGAPAQVIDVGRYLSVAGLGLAFSGGGAGDVSVTIDRETGTGVVMLDGLFVNPVRCVVR